MKLSKQQWTVLNDKLYPSRRGDYKLVSIHGNALIWRPEPLTDGKRDLAVKSEIEFAQQGRLHEHPYWQDEPIDFVNDYTRLYRQMFKLDWLNNRTDRHNIIVNESCCLTLVQYNNDTLYAYSRSTDMRNGVYSDKRVLDYLAEHINKERPDCGVHKVVWYLAVPHEYVETGIARLKQQGENE